MLGAVAVALVAINTFGGFLVTERMLEMFKKKEPKRRSAGDRRVIREPGRPVSTSSASVLFILALKGLSTRSRRAAATGSASPAWRSRSSRRCRSPAHRSHDRRAGAAVGGVIGWLVAKRVEMTQMPELVAAMHSLVGLAAVLIAIAVVNNPRRSASPIRFRAATASSCSSARSSAR